MFVSLYAKPEVMKRIDNKEIFMQTFLEISMHFGFTDIRHQENNCREPASNAEGIFLKDTCQQLEWYGSDFCICVHKSSIFCLDSSTKRSAAEWRHKRQDYLQQYKFLYYMTLIHKFNAVQIKNVIGHLKSAQGHHQIRIQIAFQTY